MNGAKGARVAVMFGLSLSQVSFAEPVALIQQEENSTPTEKGGSVADSLGAIIESKCPEASRESDTLKAKAPHPKDPKEITQPSLHARLQRMVKQDQDARFEILQDAGADIPDNDPRLARIRRIDSDNLRQLKRIFRKFGFPTIAMVGSDGVRATFLLVQHADGDVQFQANMLKVIKNRLKNGEIDPDSYAMLTDRVLRGEGKPQEYGTQFEARNGRWIPEPIYDEEHVEDRRRALGIISLSNYSCAVNAMYGPVQKPDGN